MRLRASVCFPHALDISKPFGAIHFILRSVSRNALPSNACPPPQSLCNATLDTSVRICSVSSVPSNQMLVEQSLRKTDKTIGGHCVDDRYHTPESKMEVYRFTEDLWSIRYWERSHGQAIARLECFPIYFIDAKSSSPLGPYIFSLSTMTTDPEHKPLFSTRPRDDSTSKGERLEPCIVS